MASDRFLRAGIHGEVIIDDDVAVAMLVHDSPADQEQVTVQLVEDFRCLEAMETATFQRHQFHDFPAERQDAPGDE